MREMMDSREGFSVAEQLAYECLNGPRGLDQAEGDDENTEQIWDEVCEHFDSLLKEDDYDDEGDYENEDDFEDHPSYYDY